MNKKSLIALFCCLLGVSAYATHMRAGEITYQHISGLTYEITLTTYTYSPSPADRCELEIFWGDSLNGVALSDVIQRVNGVAGNSTNGDYCDHLGEIVGQNIRKNIYVARHTYNAPTTYIISVEDPNRNEGVINIPFSVNVPFYVESRLRINPFGGHNDSPQLLNDPIDNACIFETYIHNPGAYDADGDSLSFSLISCKGEDGQIIPGYFLPSATNSMAIDPVKGDLVWDAPNLQGEYNIAILIKEWRNGVNIGSIVRDMQITVISCDNQTPVIAELGGMCVEADSLIALSVSATDPNGDLLTLMASGGPFELPVSPARFTSLRTNSDSVVSLFSWQTRCEHVERYPYQVYFRANDNSSYDLTGLETIDIAVIGKKPENVTATPVGNVIGLNWDPPACSNALGYKIYRKSEFINFRPDNCETGVPAYTGYELIATIDNTDLTTFVDQGHSDGLIFGEVYCYMLVAYYDDGAESYATTEVCTTLKKEMPIITHVTVLNTDSVNGALLVAWSKPTALVIQQPDDQYKYHIYRSDKLQGLDSVLAGTLFNLNDTLFVDTLLNTAAKQYTYSIYLFTDSLTATLVGKSRSASSVFVTATPSDNLVTLTWSEQVPWYNDQFVVSRWNNSSASFEAIALTSLRLYADTGLMNGLAYCYLITSVGGYPGGQTIFPLVNHSQTTCATPVDLEAPCPPVLTVDNDCENLENMLRWTNPNHSCADDVIRYDIYHSPTTDGSFELIHQIDNPDDTAFLHDNLHFITGCYLVAAIDSFLNESPKTTITCVDIDSCDQYVLPNVFTPNDDLVNDLFRPYPYDFVEKIEISILNRWGNTVYQTADPDVNWNGKFQQTDRDCPDGVYFYICHIFEQRLTGLTERTLTGYVHLVRD